MRQLPACIELSENVGSDRIYSSILRTLSKFSTNTAIRLHSPINLAQMFFNSFPEAKEDRQKAQIEVLPEPFPPFAHINFVSVSPVTALCTALTTESWE